MSSSLRTLAVRLPTRSSTLLSSPRPLTPICIARQSAALVCPRQSSPTLCLAGPHAFTRPASSLSNSARKAPNATDRRTAAELAKNPSASGANAAEVSSTAANAAPAGTAPALDWNTFFKLRLQRRRFQLFFSVTTGFVGAFGGAVVLTSGLAEPLLTQIPLDPFITLGLMVVACGGMGWLLGPIVGSQIFYVLNRGMGPQLRQKESEFLTRVRKNRSDPTNSSAGNPVPDFYGEKIQSVAGYRRWLKDQRAFTKKKTQAFV
ncbi:mitochondrial import protein pam17 domain-containing protein [Sarocladium implicatum]|nr:mitochondrial import protein pam17 domain-containing protein [Sarocladium implicatum]